MDRIREPRDEDSTESGGKTENQAIGERPPLPTPDDPGYWLADSAEIPTERIDAEVPAEAVDAEATPENVNGTTTRWFKGTLTGAAIAFAIVLLGLVLLHVRIANQDPEFDLGLLSPSEFWTTVKGLLVTWFPFAWVLSGLGLALSAVAYLVNRRARHVPRPVLAGALAMIAVLLLGGVAYQQFLRQVSLSLAHAEIGVAVSRQLGSTQARDQLSKYLAQVGQEGKVLVRTLPVGLNPRDTDQARELARTIDAAAVVIYREQDEEAISDSALAPPQRPTKQFGALIALANPGAGSEVAIPRRSANGNVESVELRVKAGPDAPGIQTSHLGRLMEATSGIVMYEQGRYLPAITHLRNAVSQDRSDRSDGLILYYLGSAQLLTSDEEQARQSFDEAIAVFEGRPILTIEEHLLLANAYSARASIHLDLHELDQAESSLQKAAALRQPVDNDRLALDRPSDFRHFHETFGGIYLQLMDAASRRGDSGAAKEWRKRANDASKALMNVRQDQLARSAGIWLMYRTGACEQAYRMLNDDLAQDEDDLHARRGISHLAALRSGIGSLESQQQIDELLERHPQSLQDHQMKLFTSALKIAREDQGFLLRERQTLERMLGLDPVNVPALEELVSSTETYSRLSLDPSSAGHTPTFRSLQAKLLSDSNYASGVVDYIDTARPHVNRWAELRPDSASPLVAQLRLSSAAESWLYNHIDVVPLSLPAQQPDSKIVELYDRVWRGAVEEGEGLLASTTQKTNGDLIRTHVILGEIWLHRYFATLRSDAAAADEAMNRSTTHMEAALELAAQIGTFIDQVNLANRSYISAFTVLATARPHYQSKGDSSAASRMDRLSSQALTGIQTTSAQSLADSQKRTEYLSHRSCKTGDFMRAGKELVRRGEFRPAIEVLTDYVRIYPQDPEGHRELGWAQFKNGDLNQAQESVERFLDLAPDDPQAAVRLAVIHLAQGRERPAVEQIDRALELIHEEPLGLRLRQLGLLSNDLLEVAREHEKSHRSLRQALARIDRYIGKLPAEARTREGARLVEVLSSAGEGAAWAGETGSAERFLNAGLKINPDHVLLRTSLGFAKLESGDAAGARVEYEKAVASGPRYLQDWAGRPLGSADLGRAKELLKQELESSAAALDALGGRGDDLRAAAAELAAVLRSAAAAV